MDDLAEHPLERGGPPAGPGVDLAVPGVVAGSAAHIVDRHAQREGAQARAGGRQDVHVRVRIGRVRRVTQLDDVAEPLSPEGAPHGRRHRPHTHQQRPLADPALVGLLVRADQRVADHISTGDEEAHVVARPREVPLEAQGLVRPHGRRRRGEGLAQGERRAEDRAHARRSEGSVSSRTARVAVSRLMPRAARRRRARRASVRSWPTTGSATPGAGPPGASGRGEHRARSAAPRRSRWSSSSPPGQSGG